MRPQQNRRMRGRGNNNNSNNNNGNNQNRKGPNPLTRSYESNGPDVKIRGSAQQIAEKYATLARDAQSAGDRVMAENYLQHAEHYNRIIMAAQAQMPQQPQRDVRDDDDLDEDGDERPAQQHSSGSGPQPVIEGVPAEVALTQEPVSQTSPQPEEPQDTVEGGDEAQEAAPRRQRRPRRQRAKAGEPSNEDTTAGEEPVTEAAQ